MKGKPSTGIATRRAEDLLVFHVDLLTNNKRHFYRYRDEGYYLDENINPRNEDDYVKLGYVLDKRFLVRNFNLELSTVMTDIYFSEDFALKIKFTGFPNIEAAYFKSVKNEFGQKGSEAFAEMFNTDAKLMESLRTFVSKVDIGYVKIIYNKRASNLKIRIGPYAGALMHLVFPPVFMKMPLKEEEIEALWEVMILLRRHVERVKPKE